MQYKLDQLYRNVHESHSSLELMEVNIMYGPYRDMCATQEDGFMYHRDEHWTSETLVLAGKFAHEAAAQNIDFPLHSADFLEELPMAIFMLATEHLPDVHELGSRLEVVHKESLFGPERGLRQAEIINLLTMGNYVSLKLQREPSAIRVKAKLIFKEWWHAGKLKGLLWMLKVEDLYLHENPT